VLPTYATFNSIDAGEQLWYPDSTIASHMAPDDGTFLSKSTYSSQSLDKAGNATLSTVKNIGQVHYLLLLSDCVLIMSFMSLSYVTTSYP